MPLFDAVRGLSLRLIRQGDRSLHRCRAVVKLYRSLEQFIPVNLHDEARHKIVQAAKLFFQNIEDMRPDENVQNLRLCTGFSENSIESSPECGQLLGEFPRQWGDVCNRDMKKTTLSAWLTQKQQNQNKAEIPRAEQRVEVLIREDLWMQLIDQRICLLRGYIAAHPITRAGTPGNPCVVMPLTPPASPPLTQPLPIRQPVPTKASGSASPSRQVTYWPPQPAPTPTETPERLEQPFAAHPLETASQRARASLEAAASSDSESVYGSVNSHVDTEIDLPPQGPSPPTRPQKPPLPGQPPVVQPTPSTSHNPHAPSTFGRPTPVPAIPQAERPKLKSPAPAAAPESAASGKRDSWFVRTWKKVVGRSANLVRTEGY
ncbi:hypothetical protein B0H17DRAFT_1127685 [Mycena rosella]|uniref:Uncharacterized protein n=1 Tax=Mycena rosella TaxID=1033263 RepID=A0AAD7DYJ6_MYCRO|nr:hypothetical protein B0H17DRAFT_1127685 [Mycena rosella]